MCILVKKLETFHENQILDRSHLAANKVDFQPVRMGISVKYLEKCWYPSQQHF